MPTMKRTIQRGLGSLSPTVWRQIADSVNKLVSEYHESFTAQQPQRFLARITNATKITGIARWKYGFEEVLRNPDTSGMATALFSPRTGGITSDLQSLATYKATNLLEAGNTSTLWYGVAVQGSQGIQLVSNDAFNVLPVPVNAVVEMTVVRSRGGNAFAYFSAPNPIDGDCG